MPGSSHANMDVVIEELEEVWLEPLYRQILELNHRRQLHDEFVELLEAQGHPQRGIFGEAFHRMYLDAQCLAIRRQADDDSRTLSLRRLIGQLEQHRKHFTREWYVGRWVGRKPRDEVDRKFHTKMANDAFDRFVDASKPDQLGGQVLQVDREALDRATESVVAYVNSLVAHAQREPEKRETTYDDFHEAIEHLSEMLKRYYLLINQGGLATSTPVIQGDWKGPFRQPLVSPS